MGTPKPWTVEDADQAIRWFVHRALDGRLENSLATQGAAAGPGEDERTGDRWPEAERVEHGLPEAGEAGVFEARHRRKHKTRRSVPIRAPPKRRTRCGLMPSSTRSRS